MNVLFFLTEAAPGGTTWITMGLLLVVMIAMFFFTSRSNKKQEKEAQNMRDSLQVGDEITTIGGIVGQFDGYVDRWNMAPFAFEPLWNCPHPGTIIERHRP